MNLIGIGAGLGGLLKGYEQAGQFVQQQNMNALRIQQARQQMQQEQQLNQLLDTSGLFNQFTQGGGGQMPAIGTGMAGGGVDMSQLPNTSMMGPQAATPPMPGVSSPRRQPAMAPTPMPQAQPAPTRYADPFDPSQTPTPQPPQQVQQSGGPPDSMSTAAAGGTGGGNNARWEAGYNRLVSLGVKPEVAAGAVEYMARNESGANPLALNRDSGAFGRAQWLGPRKAALTGTYGPRPTDEQQAEFMTSELQGSEAATLDALRNASTREQGYSIWGRSYERPSGPELRTALARGGQGGGEDTLAASAPPQAQRQAQTVAQNSLWNIPPQMYGRMQLQTAAQMIEKAAPSAPGHIKFLALEKLQKILAPDAKLEAAMMMMQMRDQYRRDFREDYPTAADQGLSNTRLLVGPDGKLIPWRPGQPIPENATLPGMAGRGGKTQASRNVEVTDADGKVIFKGAAHKGPDGEWVSDKDQKPVQIPDDGTIKLSSAGGAGRQAETAVQRLILAGNEIPRAMQNLVDLPTTATAGIFGGLQAERGADLSDAAKRSLANKLTPEDAQSVLVSFQGVSRALAMIEAAGAAQGLVGLTQRADVLMPRAGDTTLTILRKYAEVRQLMEQGIETVSKSSAVNDQQQKLMSKMLDQIREAVPWTVPDVNALQKRPGAETIKAFAKRVGAGSSGGYNSPEDVSKAVQDGKISVDEAKKILKEQFGYTE